MPKIKITLIFVFSIIFILSISFYLYYKIDYMKNNKLNSELQNTYIEQLPELNLVKTNDNTDDLHSQKNFDELTKINPSTIGWLQIENTKINNVVVKGDDNDFYLKHDFEKKKNMAGTIFADVNCGLNVKSKEPECNNLILYGHNQIDESMFGQLYMYKDIDFLRTHQDILYTTSLSENRYKIFAVFEINLKETSFLYNEYIDFYDENIFNDWSSNIKNLNLYQTDFTYSKTDSFITLSTCTTSTNSRLVIIGKKINSSDKITYEKRIAK